MNLNLLWYCSLIISQIIHLLTTLEIKYAPCRFCDAVSFEYAKNNLKIIQQTPADPASIEVNQPLFGDLNFNLARMKDTCSLEKVDLPGNQFNKATQVKQIAYSLWRVVHGPSYSLWAILELSN